MDRMSPGLKGSPHNLPLGWIDLKQQIVSPSQAARWPGAGFQVLRTRAMSSRKQARRQIA